MDQNFNLTLLVIINDRVELSDLFSRAERAGIKSLRLEAPEVRIGGGQGIALTIGGGNPNFMFRGAINGKDLSFHNLNYGNNVRGVFQVQIPSTKDTIIGSETFEALKDLVENLGYTDVFAYEIGINLTVDHINYPSFKNIGKLKTMNSPKLKAIKLIDGDTQGRDLREEYISEISMERLATPPNKSVINVVYRMNNFRSDALRDILDDIDDVIKQVR